MGHAPDERLDADHLPDDPRAVVDELEARVDPERVVREADADETGEDVAPEHAAPEPPA